MKVIHILLIIIFILFTILGVKVYNSNKEPEYSISDIQEILDKANDIKNYECKLDNCTYKRKDYKIVKANENVISIADYFQDEAIIFKPGTTTYISTKVGKNAIPEEIYSANSLIIDDLSKLKLIKLKETKYNEEECFEVKFKGVYINDGWLSESSEYSYHLTIWINCKNGLIMKSEAKMLGKRQINEYIYKFNTVTEEDVTPDLTGYEKVVDN